MGGAGSVPEEKRRTEARPDGGDAGGRAAGGRGGNLLYEAFAHSCELHTLSECITVKSGISALEKEAVRLGIPLFRCHRSYAVNIAQVRAIEREAGPAFRRSRIPVSRRLIRAEPAVY